ncbi:MAG TPA: hypothetical protein VFK57_08015 [Vicinamibacterales bacterium]|nr:hypothetical protein [Vicinamibacterales bacterium]
MRRIVVFRQSDRIILASDSREIGATPDDRRLHPGERRPKIRIYGPWALTLCGLSKGPNGLDVREAIGREIAPERSMAEALSAVRRVFERRVFPALRLAAHYPSTSPWAKTSLFHLRRQRTCGYLRDAAAVTSARRRSSDN